MLQWRPLVLCPATCFSEHLLFTFQEAVAASLLYLLTLKFLPLPVFAVDKDPISFPPVGLPQSMQSHHLRSNHAPNSCQPLDTQVRSRQTIQVKYMRGQSVGASTPGRHDRYGCDLRQPLL